MKKISAVLVVVSFLVPFLALGFAVPVLAQEEMLDPEAEKVMREMKTRHTEFHKAMDLITTALQDDPELLKAVDMQHTMLHEGMKSHLDHVYLGIR